MALADAGVLEVSLLGQNVNSYGTDLPGHRQLFGDLLRALDGVEGLERLRFTSPNPKDFRDDVVEAMATCRPLCEHVHFPLQSGSDRVLRLMRRGYRRRRYLEILAGLRAAIPGVAFSTDIIVGFPGETDAEFEALLEFLDEAQLDRVGAFAYSPVTGAAANALPDPVPEAVKQARLARFMERQAAISEARLAAKVGSVQQVLVDAIDGELAIARSMADAPEIDGLVQVQDGREAGLQPGDFAMVRIMGSDEHDLYGEVAYNE